MWALDGQTVTVRTRSQVGTDRLGEPVYEWADPGVEVDGVLVSWATADDREPRRPDGVYVTAHLVFPRSCTLDLRGAKVVVGGDELVVSGVPHHVTEVPGFAPRDMVVEAGVRDG